MKVRIKPIAGVIKMGSEYNNHPSERDEMEQFTQRVLLLFGQSLQRERKAKKLTQEGLSSLTGISAKYIGELEAAKKNPSVRFLVFLADALKVHPCTLLGLPHHHTSSDILIKDKCSLVEFIKSQDEAVLRDIVQLLRRLKQ